jgi:hypothetical protein
MDALVYLLRAEPHLGNSPQVGGRTFARCDQGEKPQLGFASYLRT